MAAFTLGVLGFFGCGKSQVHNYRPLRIAAKTTKFQIVVPLTDMARWSIRMGRAIRQTRRTQRGQYNFSSIANGLSFKLRRKKVTSQYNTITMTANWRIGRGIRKRRDSSRN